MMRKTHEKAGIGTIALVPGLHQWKSGSRFADKALHVGTGVTFQAPKWVISSHFMVQTTPVVDWRKKIAQGLLTTPVNYGRFPAQCCPQNLWISLVITCEEKPKTLVKW